MRLLIGSAFFISAAILHFHCARISGADEDADGYRADVDCNDNDPSINPRGVEVCNGFDDDCDSLIDEQGNSLHFDGVDDGVIFHNKFLFHDPGDATLEFWLKCKPTRHHAIFWTRPDNVDSNRFNIYVNSNRTFGLDYREPDGILHEIANGVHLILDQWVHIAIVRKESSSYSIYVNGLLAASGYDPSPNLPTSTEWKIGYRPGCMYDGYIDEIRFWNVARMQAEILATMSVHINAKNERSLIGYYTFDQGAGNGENSNVDSVIDFSNNHNNGVMRNFALNTDSSNFVSPTPISCFVRFPPHLGIDSSSQQFAVPNPSYGVLYLKHELKPDEDANIRITDINGAEVINHSLRNPDGSIQTEIDIRRLKAGSYTVVLYSEYYASTERLVIPE